MELSSSQTKEYKHESSFKFSELINFSNSITCQLMTGMNRRDFETHYVKDGSLTFTTEV
jgi:hypothetical protein